MFKKISILLLLSVILLAGCSQMTDLEWTDGEEYNEFELEEMVSDQLEDLNPEYDDIGVDIYEETED